MIRISAVIPLLNEAENFQALSARLVQVLEKLGGSYEIIFVDDGSADATLSCLQKAAAADSRIKYLSLSRNFGQQTAISAGLEHAEGDVVAVLDADLQDPPELIPAMLEKWAAGSDVVYAVRTRRKENLLLKSVYALFYRFLKSTAQIEIPLDAGDFCLMDRAVVEALKAMPERNRYLRGLRAWSGFSQTGLEYERDRRLGGRSKYTLAKLARLAWDGVTSFSNFPIIFSNYAGLLLMLSGFLGGIFLFLKHPAPGGNSAFLAAAIFAMAGLTGLQLFMLGITGNYISRIYGEVQRRPLYLVKAQAHLKGPPDGSPVSEENRRRYRQSGKRELRDERTPAVSPVRS